MRASEVDAATDCISNTYTMPTPNNNKYETQQKSDTSANTTTAIPPEGASLNYKPMENLGIDMADEIKAQLSNELNAQNDVGIRKIVEHK